MDNLNQNPEQIARDEIDTQLRASGWVVQHKGEWNHNEAGLASFRAVAANLDSKKWAHIPP